MFTTHGGCSFLFSVFLIPPIYIRFPFAPFVVHLYFYTKNSIQYSPGATLCYPLIKLLLYYLFGHFMGVNSRSRHLIFSHCPQISSYGSFYYLDENTSTLNKHKTKTSIFIHNLDIMFNLIQFKPRCSHNCS